MSKLETQALIETLLANSTDGSIEAQMLRPKLMRQLYNTLGEPSQDDYPDVFLTTSACGFSKMEGYTTVVPVSSADAMRAHNTTPVLYHISRPSQTKTAIIERYLRDNWSITVQAYNVMCSKYVPHPRYEHVWVFFYVSRNCAKYRYVLESPDE